MDINISKILMTAHKAANNEDGQWQAVKITKTKYDVVDGQGAVVCRVAAQRRDAIRDIGALMKHSSQINAEHIAASCPEAIIELARLACIGRMVEQKFRTAGDAPAASVTIEASEVGASLSVRS